MSVTENRLAELGIALPDANAAVANYVCVQRVGNMLYFSGCGPMSGSAPLYQGKLGSELTVEEGYNAARAAMLALLGQLKQELGDLDRVKRFVKLLAFVASAPDFTQQPAVVNGASDLLVEVFGERGRHARSAIGVSVLPFDIPVEIEMIVETEG